MLNIFPATMNNNLLNNTQSNANINVGNFNHFIVQLNIRKTDK